VTPSVVFRTARSAPRGAEAVGVPVFVEGAGPRALGLSRAALSSLGFDAKVGQTYVSPNDNGVTIAVGMGAAGDVSANSLRKSAAALARAAEKRASLALTLGDLGRIDARTVGQSIAEGMTLALYRFNEMRSNKSTPALAEVTVVTDASRQKSLESGLARGAAIGAAVCLARDLSNRPPNRLTATSMAEIAVAVASESGLGVEVWDLTRLQAERCNGIVAVNAGSKEPPALVKLTYTPRNPVANVALVGKGITFDSGGLSLKPSDGMANMKMDMSGAGSVLAAMSALRAARCKVRVTAYLCCTDNLPGGAAMKVSDVITYRNGKTVEVMNTDAEGRLVLADALVLASEEKPDAIVDIATLTGACMIALGTKVAAAMGNHDGLVQQVLAASKRADEPMWELPLVPEYRKLLDSEVADMKNIGGPYGGAITAGLFLQEFVDGAPWVHLDIAGKERADGDEDWKVKGASGFGVRTFVEFLDTFKVPQQRR
jgi:leucyl aminopeptidase